MALNPVSYEFDSVPESGQTMAVADGIHWLRMPLPFQLNHINLWLLEQDDGWSIVDTGIASDVSKGVWEETFAGTMAHRPARQILVTHLHPDHVGCAGFLTRRFDIELHMTREEYMLCRVLVADTGKSAPEEGIDFYRAAGFTDESLDRYRSVFGFFGKLVSRLPESYIRLHDKDRLTIGNHEWEVMVGRGHSPEHACFYSTDLNLLISGDQVLPSISANVSVYPTEPEANPLRYWFESLEAIKARLPDDVLVLPAHGKPFRGAHQRIDALIDEHKVKLEQLLAFIDRPCRALDVFPALYKTEIPADQLILATGEALAHLHYLMYTSDVVAETDARGVTWYSRA